VNDRLVDFVTAHPDLFVLTGAGLSTSSGIGDYRGDDGTWKRRPPVELRDFLRSDHARRRYWSRSMIGWPPFAAARPNDGHRALANLQRANRIAFTVTQNVDGLHGLAGHTDVIELHGRLADVRCLDCDALHPRATVQDWLAAGNPRFMSRSGALLADGDVELGDDALDDFCVPVCSACGGTLKPDIVFFGESVPRPTVEAALSGLERASAVLIVGSSVMVYSSFRFCRAAHATGKPIVAVNRGVTRADALLDFKVAADCASTLHALSLCFARCSVQYCAHESRPRLIRDDVRLDRVERRRRCCAGVGCTS
jgi:NAD-dependent SIR2 family protein deacetylase